MEFDLPPEAEKVFQDLADYVYLGYDRSSSGTTIRQRVQDYLDLLGTTDHRAQAGIDLLRRALG